MLLENLAILCDISYSVTQSGVYHTTAEDEIKMFKSISNDIIHIPSCDGDQAILTTSLDRKILYIAVAGTHNIEGFFRDASAIQIYPRFDMDRLIVFHYGFYKQFEGLLSNFKSLVEQFIANDCTHIYLAGHSSGGATAAILAYYLKKINICIELSVVTFGSPCFTNMYGAEWFADNVNFIRVEDHRDPIPKLLTDDASIYAHVSRKHVLFKGGKMLINPILKKTQYCTFSWFLKLFLKKGLNLQYHSILNYILKLKK